LIGLIGLILPLIGLFDWIGLIGLIDWIGLTPPLIDLIDLIDFLSGRAP
jgi:hypothetical protein